MEKLRSKKKYIFRVFYQNKRCRRVNTLREHNRRRLRIDVGGCCRLLICVVVAAALSSATEYVCTDL